MSPIDRPFGRVQLQLRGRCNQTPCNTIPPGCTPTAGLDACFNQSCPSDGSIAVTSTCGPNCEISNATAKHGDDCVPGTITNTNAVDTVTWPPPKHGNCAQITVFLNCVCPERGVPMDLQSCMLCDAAEVRDNLLFVLGGGVQRFHASAFPVPVPVQLAGLLEVDAIDTCAAHEIVMTVVEST